MIKFVTTFLILTCGLLFLAFEYPPKLNSSRISQELTTNEEFSIFSRLTYRHWEDDFKWTSENCWRLIEYPQNEIKLISEKSTAPDAFGGDLFQCWTFKALQPGAFDFIFQLDDDQRTISVLVIPNTI